MLSKRLFLGTSTVLQKGWPFMLFHYNWMHSWPFYGLHSTSNCLEKRIKIEVRINQSLKNHSSPFFTTQGSSWIINGTFRQLWWNRQENYCGRSFRGWWGRPWASKVIHHHLFPGYAYDDADTMISTGWEFSLVFALRKRGSDFRYFLRYPTLLLSHYLLIKYHPGL